MSRLSEGFVRAGRRGGLAAAAAGVALVLSAGNPCEAAWNAASGHAKAPSPAAPGRAVPDAAALPGGPVFAPDSTLPQAEPPAAPGPLAETLAPQRIALTNNPCDICLEGSLYVQWTGSSGHFTAQTVSNHRTSGTSGTLKLQIRLSSTMPVWGSTITAYNFSDPYMLNPLQAGYYYSNLNSGTTTFYQNIPAGTYYLVMMLSEYSGSQYYYEDFYTFSSMVTCTGSGCTVGGGAPPATCTPDANTLCLHGGRFKVQADYMDYSHNNGTAKAVSLTDDSGYFWFFSSSNVELVCKMVSFCSGSSGNWGFYASGLTDVQVTFKVTDTSNGMYRTYPNALAHRFTTIADGPYSCP